MPAASTYRCSRTAHATTASDAAIVKAPTTPTQSRSRSQSITPSEAATQRFPAMKIRLIGDPSAGVRPSTSGTSQPSHATVHTAWPASTSSHGASGAGRWRRIPAATAAVHAAERPTTITALTAAASTTTYATVAAAATASARRRGIGGLHRRKRPVPEAGGTAYPVGVAVLIASNLRKELAGGPLFDGVSFKVERRDRLALAGPNGAGKTTLLRALSGEASLQGGELAWEKGARVALHDQRPPAESDRPLRDYVLAGTADLAAVEAELRSLEHAMAGGTHDAATLRRYAEAQARLEHAGGYDWRDRAASVVRGLGFTDGDLDRPLRTFSGGELTRASLARALASQPDLLLLDE